MPSLGMAYMKKENCYDDVYMMCGETRHFLQNFVHGGVVQLRNNRKRKLYDIIDVDGCSLYPSAINKIGFPKGKPKYTKEIPANFDALFLQINITKVNKKQDNPLIWSTNDNGIKIFHNNPVDNFYVTHIDLEELIKYHDIEYEIIRGLYFDEGSNTKCQKVIKHLYDTRKKYKKTNPCYSTSLKLLMNSIYGKSITKASNKKIYYVKDSTMKNLSEDFIVKNFEIIRKIEKYPNYHKITVKRSQFDHSNYAHVGSLILSMSKRIMNNVKYLGIPVHYTDTDSMFIDRCRFDDLVERYEQKFGRPLIGDDLGQFHNDLPKGYKYISKMYLIGKKCYLAQMVHENGSNGLNPKFKGVCKELLYKNPWINYGKLFRGKSVEYDLIKSGKMFITYEDDSKIKVRTEFKRVIS